MMKNKLLIIGAGGHGRVVAEAAGRSDQWEVIGFCDDTLDVGYSVMNHLNVLAKTADANQIGFDAFIVAIGNNRIRCEIFDRLIRSHKAGIVIHPFTSVSSEIEMGEGSVILAGAVISNVAAIGKNCIIGSNVHIDHESVIGDHVHIRNGTSIGSNCTIGSFVTTETGSGIQPFTSVEAPCD